MDAARAALLIVSALRGAVYQALLDPEAVSIDAALGDLKYVVDALLAAPGSQH